MNAHRHADRARIALSGWRGAIALSGLLAALIIWCGCTVTKSNYETLSFFFDGVPDPNAAAKSSTGDSTMAEQVMVHRPFAEEKCEACHKTQYRPGKNDPRACLECHKDLGQKQAWTHGAVAGGACLWCHSPHESARKWLLRNQDRKVCMQCHSATMLHGDTVPAHVDPKSGCLECHFGHGGDNALMLRPGATAKAPPPPTADKPVETSKPADTKPAPHAPPSSPSTSAPDLAPAAAPASSTPPPAQPQQPPK